MPTLLKDLRLAFRLLAKKPGLSTLAVLSLALGIGVNSSMFTLVNALLLRDVPAVRPHEVVDVFTSDSDGGVYGTSSYPDFRDLREDGEVLADLMAVKLGVLTFDDGVNVEVVFGEEVSGNYFDFLGLPLALGRGFLPEEDRTPGSHPVVVLAYDFWQKRFASEAAVLGRTVKLNGLPFTVVGVAGEDFPGIYPIKSAVFVPLLMHDTIAERGLLDERGTRGLLLRGRLAPGTSIEQAQARFTTLAKNLEAAYPATNRERRLTLVRSSEVTLNPEHDGKLFGVAAIILALVAMVLLIACSNIANLLLARAADRRREIAVRLALGSSRGLLIRQLMAEGMVLAGLGGAFGLLLAAWTTRLIVSFQPPLPVPIAIDLGIDGKVLAYTLTLALLTGVASALAPALQASKADLVPALKDEAAALGRSYRKLGLRNLLVIAQVAVSTVLLVGAGLFLRSLGSAQDMDPGFDLRRGVAANLDLGMGRHYSEEEGRAYFHQLLERARLLPGARSAVLAENLPISLGNSTYVMEVEDLAGQEDLPEIAMMRISPGYFDTLGISLVRGRDISENDAAGSPDVVVVNETAARRFWPGQSPIGKRLRFGRGGEGRWMEVIGVARDGKYFTLGEAPRPFVYRPFRQDYASSMTLVVASELSETQMLSQVRDAIEAQDPATPIFDLRTITSHLSVTLFPARFGATLLAAFGVLGLVLASAGLYGVVAYSVSRRIREIGVRMAIGAARTDILGLVVREGMVLVGVGMALGLAAALAGSQLLTSLLYGVRPGDPLTLGGVAFVLAGVALLANLVPARRATLVDPIEALRYE